MRRADKLFGLLLLAILTVFAGFIVGAITGCGRGAPAAETVEAVDCLGEINRAIQRGRTCPEAVQLAVAVYQLYPSCRGSLESAGLRLVCHDLPEDGGADGAY